MPNVVVYVPAKFDRTLRAAGISPSTIVKNGAREALINVIEQLGETVSDESERDDGGNAVSPEGSVEQDRASNSVSRSESFTESTSAARSAKAPTSGGAAGSTPKHAASEPVDETRKKKRMYPCKHHFPASKHCTFGCDD